MYQDPGKLATNYQLAFLAVRFHENSVNHVDYLYLSYRVN
jgi:hypothetical protein